MTRDDLKDIVERYVEVWKRRDPEGIARFHAVDGIAETPMYATLRGRKAIEHASRAFFSSFPDATFEYETMVVDPPRVAVFITVNATHMNDFFGLPGTNRHIEFRVSLHVDTNDEGLIEHERRNYDFTALLLQLGVLRAKPMKP